jgi:hypothetical protein
MLNIFGLEPKLSEPEPELKIVTAPAPPKERGSMLIKIIHEKL